MTQKNGVHEIEAWKEEHPLTMKRKPIMTPQDVIDSDQPGI